MAARPHLTGQGCVRTIAGVPPDPASHADRRVTDLRVTVRVSGRVQGVGFRWWTRARALELGLVGSATNLPDGRVEVVAQGPRAACGQLLAMLSGPGTPGRVRHVASWEGVPRDGLTGFVER